MTPFIKVGFAYKIKRFGNVLVHIIHNEGSGDLPFIGLTSNGAIIRYDKHGKDEFYECGGHWYQLDLTTAKPTNVCISNFNKTKE